MIEASDIRKPTSNSQDTDDRSGVGGAVIGGLAVIMLIFGNPLSPGPVMILVGLVIGMAVGTIIASEIVSSLGPRLGVFSLPVGIGLVFAVPSMMVFTAKQVIAPMQLATYPDIWSVLVTLIGQISIMGPVSLLTLGFLGHGAVAVLPGSREQEDLSTTTSTESAAPESPADRLPDTDARAVHEFDDGREIVPQPLAERDPIEHELQKEREVRDR